MKWFYVENGAPQGPVTEEELRSLRSSGKLTSSSLVWREGMEKWEHYSESLGEDVEASTTPPMIAPKMTEDAQAVEPVRYAGFWIRGAAKIIDVLILSFLHLILMLSLGKSSSLVEGEDSGVSLLSLAFGMALSIGYFTFFHGRNGETPGKKLLGIKVVSPNGESIGYQRALGRALVEVLSRLIVCIGYIMAAFDSEKKSLHDIICETRVVYKK